MHEAATATIIDCTSWYRSDAHRRPVLSWRRARPKRLRQSAETEMAVRTRRQVMQVIGALFAAAPIVSGLEA